MLVPIYSDRPGEQYAGFQAASRFPQWIEPARPSPWPLVLAAGIVLGAAWIVGRILDPTPPRRPGSRRYTVEPVSAADKDYVSERDGWLCTYCGRRVTRRTRHVDHSVSRANGGTNHLNNLRLACAACNLGKGALNSREFTRSFR